MSERETEAVQESGPVPLKVSGKFPSDVCRACGKLKYEARGAAMRQARWWSRKNGTAMKAYFSDECGCWHLTRAV